MLIQILNFLLGIFNFILRITLSYTNVINWKLWYTNCRKEVLHIVYKRSEL